MTALSELPIVVVEDSDDDFEAMERALKRDGHLANPIVRFDNGGDALDYLLRRPPYDSLGSADTPGLVLLDLNMPGVDGRTVLTEMKSRDKTKSIPVVIMTTSDDDWDINQCYSLGANTYVQKPVDLERFFNAVKALKQYWLQVAVLPRAC